MAHYNLTIGHWDGYTENQEIDIPDNIKFFYRDGEVGDMLKKDCNHYTTIIETEKYKDWLDNLKGFYIRKYKCGKYTILYFTNIHNDTPLPVVDREEWFSHNRIDLNQYVFVTYSENYVPICVHRIVNFINPLAVECIVVTRRNWFHDDKESYGILKTTIEYQGIEPSEYFYAHEKKEIMEGIEADEIYNSMIRDVLDEANYDDRCAIKYNYNFKRARMESELEKKYINISNCIEENGRKE